MWEIIGFFEVVKLHQTVTGFNKFTQTSWLIFNTPNLFISEQKRRMKAEKKAAEKEAKVKEQKQELNDKGEENAFADEETLDPNVRFY